MLTRNPTRIAALGVPLLVAALASAADSPTLLNANEVQWTDVAEPAGAKQAALWNDASSNDSGVLVRWQFNSKLPNVVRTQHAHIVVLAGTFTLDIGGRYKEFGPGGFASIPGGVQHSMGCEAAGECTFMLHLSGSSTPAAAMSSQ